MVHRVTRPILVALLCGFLPQTASAQPIDPLEGLEVREIRVIGLRNIQKAVVERNLATQVGAPFHRSTIVLDQRRLDELRMFTAVAIEPRLEGDGVVVQVAVTETMRLLPVIVFRVTDENGVSAGVGLRGINLFGRGMQSSASVSFGGETSVAVAVDATTITPGTWSQHVGFNYSTRHNVLYDFDERATTTDARVGRNWSRGLRIGVAAELLAIDTGESGLALSPDGFDVIPTLGAFFTVDTLDSSTNPRAGTWGEIQVDRRFVDAHSWTIVLDGRRFQRLSEKHGLGVFALSTLQSGDVGSDLPEYLQFALGGANTVRGWSLGSRRGGSQFIGTLEYTYVVQPVRPFSVAGLNLYAGLQVVGFGDVGLAWNEKDDLKAASGIDGYGFGLRLLVPFVDLIRLDAAWGEPGQGASVYFAVSLKAARQRQRVR